MRPSSRGLLLTVIFMMQAAQDRTCHDTQMLWNPVPVGWQRNRRVRGPLWDAWCKGPVRTTLVIMWHPLLQQASSEETKRGRDDDTDITSDHRLGMLAYKREPALGREAVMPSAVQRLGQIRA